MQGRMRPEIGGCRSESSENPWRRSLKGLLSRRSSEEFRGVQRSSEMSRDVLYAMVPASERHKNRGRTLDVQE